MTHPNQNPTASPGPRRHWRPISLGPFITRMVGVDDDGHRVVVTSRRHRKHLPPLRLLHRHALQHEPVPAKAWFRFWAPTRGSWWMAILFIIGSALFALGAALAMVPDLRSPWWPQPLVNNLIFFVGSIFFTAAATLQLLQSINGDISAPDFGVARRPWRWFAWRPRNLGYLSSLIQFIGTILFNINTGDALLPDLTTTEKNLAIWTPNLAGSACFLVSSLLGYLEVAHRIGAFNFRDLTMWIASCNNLGSIAFQIAAVASFTLATDETWWIGGANGGVLIGGLLFLVGSYLLIPELFEKTPARHDQLAPA